MTKEEIRALPINKQVQREVILSKLLWAYQGRWVMIKNQDIVASDETLNGLIGGRERRMKEADAVFRVPEENVTQAYYQQYADSSDQIDFPQAV